MSTTTPSTYLITGANRGIGKGLVTQLLLRPNHTIVATVRDPSSATAAALHSVPRDPTTRLIVAAYDARDDASAPRLVDHLTSSSAYNLTSLDVLIANAAVGDRHHRVLDDDVDLSSLMRDYLSVNTVAPIALLRAFTPLLRASPTRRPVFMPLSSALASMGSQPMVFSHGFRDASPYGASKAALNWMVVRLHLEETDWGLVTWAQLPGLVVTDMAVDGLMGGDEAALRAKGAIEVEESVRGILGVVDGATREETGGKLIDVTGEEMPW